MATLVIFLVIVLAIGFWLIGLYNGLVRARNQYKNAFSQIDVQLHRRHDLIPNLVETAKGYMAHEKDTLEAVINARNSAISAGKTAQGNPGDADAMMALAASENQLSSALGRLFALAEAYPDLKANENMMQLSEELTTTENKIAFARQAYNDAVTAFNNLVETFPSSIIAGMFGFVQAKLLEISESDAQMKETPKVSF